MLFPPKFSWPRYVAWTRVLLAAVALVLSYFYLQPPAAPLFYSLMSVYLAYGIVIATQGRAHLGILGLLALFTHIHLFWVAGLLLAMIDIPDFGTPLRSIAGSVEKIADTMPDTGSEAEQETSLAPASVPPDTAKKEASIAKKAGGGHV